MSRRPEDIIAALALAIQRNKETLTAVADTDEERLFLTRQGKKMEQIRKRYMMQYDIRE